MPCGVSLKPPRLVGEARLPVVLKPTTGRTDVAQKSSTKASVQLPY
jgi:hypothetical protein